MDISWLDGLREGVIDFLSKLRRDGGGALYSYSLTGDRPADSIRWGLGQSVFAAKIYYMLDALGEEDKARITGHIISFQDERGYLYDPHVERLSRARRLAGAIRGASLDNLFNEQTRRAETRQAFAALRCLGTSPRKPFLRIPYDKGGIEKYVNSLDWNSPWGASSHVSHLVFFINSNRALFGTSREDADDLIDTALGAAERYRRSDGSWYAEGASISTEHKVNSAMKMMTAYSAAGRKDFTYPERLIDLCLSSGSMGHACDSFNVICVLYHCSRLTGHMPDKVVDYCKRRLELYRRHYWPEHGGFSFYEGKANSVYYGAKISDGLPEPDIHGTVLFLWGITLISLMLGIEPGFKPRVPYT